MYKLYEKVPKSKENLYGQREIKKSPKILFRRTMSFMYFGWWNKYE